MVRPRKIKTEKPDVDETNDVEVMDVDGDDHEVIGEEVTSGHGAVAAAAANDGEEDDDDDEIVREIPVFLSPDLAGELQLVQFPLQQQHRPTGIPEAVRVKPKHCLMEIDLGIPDNIHRQGLYQMPARTFVSQTVPVSTHMALGKMMPIGGNDKDGKPLVGLHLVPLLRMTQMRPSFAHIDEAAASSSATTTLDEDPFPEVPKSSNSPERKSISFRKKESERQQLARKSSYGYKKATEDAEVWDSLAVYDAASLQARVVMEKVACPREHLGRNLLDVDELKSGEHGAAASHRQKKIPGTSLNAAYLNTLNYLPSSDPPGGFAAGAAGSLGGGETSEQTELATIVTKLVRLMRSGMPIPFSLLRNEFPEDGVSDATLCVALGSCAVLVRGNWCLQSRLLSYSPAMTRARTFLLCLFQSMGVVHRERLARALAEFDDDTGVWRDPSQKTGPEDDAADAHRVTPEALELLLDQLGEKTPKGWILKVADDESFARKHPQTTLVHLQYWHQQVERFAPRIERYRSDEPLA